MIDQLLHALQEMQGVRHFSVSLERGFVAPARMDPMKPRVSDGPEGCDRKAAGLGSRGCDDIADCRHDRLLQAFAGAKAREYDELHIGHPIGSSGWIGRRTLVKSSAV